MAILDTKELSRRGAALAAGQRERSRELVLLYCGTIAALSLGSTGLNLLLDSRIGTTGGLDGLGLRSVLQTLQELLSYIIQFFSTFWSAGFLYSMLNLVRGTEARHTDLLEGFRRFGRILLATLYQTMLTISLGFSTFLLAMLIFFFTPLADPFMELMVPVVSDPNIYLPDGTLNVALIPAEAITTGSIPMIVIWMVLLLSACVYLGYCFRMGTYLMMERKIGGVAALFTSRVMMRGHKWQMMKLDLHFWWYHLLQGLLLAAVAVIVVAGDRLLPGALSDTAKMFLAMGVYYALLTVLYLWKKCDVDAAYLLAFEAIAHPREDALTEADL